MVYQCVLINNKMQKKRKMRLKFNLRGYVWKWLKNKKEQIMSEKLEELISLLYQDRLTQCGKRLLVENIEKLQKENEELNKENEELHREINQRIKLKIENEKIVDTQFIYKPKIKDKIEESENVWKGVKKIIWDFV